MKTKYAKDHLRVKDMIECIHKETRGSTCVRVVDLASEIDMDTRVLRNHLEIMEIDGYGTFHDRKKRQIFCINNKEGD